ncbi:hypothetical protein, conserved [Trypanosoma brucei gambiense DAL972]|uniref:Uncharacterized protein n=2 Tax=Trypanosoma brucei TaxID=5691 RepID=D0A6M7_TRYB9|nr:hypothetical protein, conserved [Trypanosoma brucei gambiense DAL972]RHW67698.1 hypothetical protein DPX39_110046300 [Trypanosoma brucei equiperdum]CBH17328.1 hypothetical protein, conserved [Trypanosoma brucei gambiense DAL972]|eukprot:XP_011779592.1 hypothetical protein, conserved [Trypanosoma brucei gambiense DAL972]
MARRQRVPRIKEHRKKRNKNPKLSPYQRELRRTKLANQPPIMKANGRDCSISQRSLSQYLAERHKREQQRKQRRREKVAEAAAAAASASEGPGGVGTPIGSDSTSLSSPPLVNNGNLSDGLGERNKKSKVLKLAAKRVRTAEKADSGVIVDTKAAPVPLNEQIAATLARPVLAFRTRDGTGAESITDDSKESIIARKKEKKHRKKVEARRERLQAKLQEMEKQLADEVLSTKGGKKRRRADPVDAKDIAYERMLRKMQKEKAATEAAEKRAAGKKGKKTVDSNNLDGVKEGRKRISFDDGISGTETGDGPHRPMRYPKDKGEDQPRDFCELVDVVRYGERVEAPPVFDTVPSRNASITRLASRLDQSSQRSAKGAAKGPQSERLRLLSSVGGMGEQRRLERLGFVPADGSTKVTRGSGQALSKEEEMERLRLSVVEAYRRNKRVALEARNGTDMRHQFPLFS